jgi:hypothetical protein
MTSRRDRIALTIGTTIGRASVRLGLAPLVHRIATWVLQRYDQRQCSDCGRTLTQSGEERESGLCLRCLNGPMPVTKPPTPPPASDVTQREA